MWEKVKERAKRLGKWALVAFIIFELIQLALGIYGGVILALEITEDWDNPAPTEQVDIP